LGLACAFVALVGCGGGGSGGGNVGGSGEVGSSAPSPAPGSSASSLIPAAPALGATLEADATQLMPQVDGATWTFWGRRTDEAGAELLQYQARYTLARSGNDWLLKSTSSANDGEGTERWAIVGGEVQQVGQAQFVAGQPAEELRHVLLRSPVRAGDQITAFTKHVEAAPDVDGDGKADPADWASYTRVIGAETVTLADGTPVSAIRVDLHLLQRVWLSKSNRYSEVLEFKWSHWFAKGLGRVRRQLPSPTPTGLILKNDERLVTADLASAGVGATPPVPLAIPLNSPERAGQPLASGLNSVQRVQDGVLVVSDNPVVGYPAGQWLTMLDARGQVQWSRSGPPGLRRFSPLGGGLVAWEFGETVARVQRLDARGNLLTAAPQTLDMGSDGDPAAMLLGLSNVEIAADTQSLWAAAVRRDLVRLPDGFAVVRDSVVVRGFDTEGRPLTEPLVLGIDERDGHMSFRPRIAAVDGRAVVAWAQTVGGVPQIRLVSVNSQGQVSQGAPVTDGINVSSDALEVRASAGGALLVSTSGFSWINDDLSLGGLDRVGRVTPLLPLSGVESDNVQWAITGNSLLRFGFEPGELAAAPSAAGAWKGGKLQVFRRGQPLTERRLFLSAENGSSMGALVDFGDHALLLHEAVLNGMTQWTSRVIWLNP